MPSAHAAVRGGGEAFLFNWQPRRKMLLNMMGGLNLCGTRIASWPVFSYRARMINSSNLLSVFCAPAALAPYPFERSWPSIATSVHAVCSFGAFSTSTRHMRHAACSDSPG